MLFEAAQQVATATAGRQRPAMFVQGVLPDIPLVEPSRPLDHPRKGPWGRLPELDDATPSELQQAPLELPDPELTIERPTSPGRLMYGLAARDWEQGFPGDLVNEVLDTGRWPQVEAGYARAEPYAATLVAIRNMVVHRPDWGTPDQALARRAAMVGARAGIRQAFVVLGWMYSVGAGGLPPATPRAS